MDTKELGDFGEKMACEYLVKNRFKIMGRNYWISFGEIDIIARKKFSFFSRAVRPIHFVEVKTIISNNDDFFPEEKVNYKKQQKLRNLAQIWLQKNKFLKNRPYQIDIIGILINQETKESKLHYFENVIADSPN